MAKTWLNYEQRLIERWRAGVDEWQPPAQRIADLLAAEKNRALTVAEFLPVSLDARRVRGRPLQARTRAEQEALMRRHVLPGLGEISLDEVSREMVESWWATVAPGRPTTRRHAYSALHTLFADAVDRGLVTANPVRIRGAATTQVQRELLIPTADQIHALVESMPVEHQLMILLGALCGLRYGEVTALRRCDIDLDDGVIRVRAAVVEVRGEGFVRKETKTGEKRDVPVPPPLLTRLREHLLAHTQLGTNGLLFYSKSGGPLPQSSFRGNREVVDDKGTVVKRGRGFDHARQLVGLDDLRFHDLRHTCGTWYAQRGASMAEVMRILGHSTQDAALRYQHYTEARGRELSERLSDLAGGDW